MKSLQFTIDAIKAIQAPEKGVLKVRDLQNKDLCLFITPTGTRTFYIRKRVNKRDQRIRIGNFPTITISQARAIAGNLAAKINLGGDPIAEKRREEERDLTLQNQCVAYIEQHAKRKNKKWMAQQREIELYFKPLLPLRLKDITRSDVDRLHSKIGERAPIQANRVIALLRAIFNHAIKKGWEGTNPARGFDRFKETSRDRFILPEEMPFFMKSLDLELNETMADFFKLLLFIGARRDNVRLMRWEQIDWKSCQWRIPETKNGQPQTVPLVEFAMAILVRRKSVSISPWVFPQKKDPKKPMDNPQKAWKRVKANATLALWEKDEELAQLIQRVRDRKTQYSDNPHSVLKLVQGITKRKGIDLPRDMMDLRMHDLRRTFGSYQAITGTSLHVIGKSLGHKSLAATQIYARLNLDPVRESIEKATKSMIASAANY